jgi:hypothetical protein
MGDIVRGNTIVIEQIPLSFVFHDAMMGCPTDYRVKDNALIGEWSVRVVTDGIAEEMTVTCRIREIVLPVIFVHP